jgi:hypothetical protein
MPLFIRKGIRVGPFRFNLSKSGVGVSLGVTGLRVGTGPRGAYVHAGRGGLYYRQSLGGRGRGPSRPGDAARKETSRAGSSPRNEASVVEGIDSGCVLQMQDVPGSSLLDELRTNAQRPRLVVPAVLAAAAALGVAQEAGAPCWGLGGLFARGGAAGAAVGLRYLTRRTTVVLY